MIRNNFNAKQIQIKPVKIDLFAKIEIQIIKLAKQYDN